MEIIVKISACAACALFAGVILRENNKQLAVLLSLVCIATVLLFSFRSTLGAVFASITELCTETGFTDYGVVLVKALGIAYIGSITAQMCDTCGETGISGAVAMCAKIEIIAVSLPLLSRLFDIAREVLK